MKRVEFNFSVATMGDYEGVDRLIDFLKGEGYKVSYSRVFRRVTIVIEGKWRKGEKIFI
jgi:hypothetical protein